MLQLLIFCLGMMTFDMFVKAQSRAEGCLVFAMAEDGDMKIAPDFSARRSRSAEDAAEEGAAEFIKNRESGNIEKARALGRELALALMTVDPALEEFSSNEGLATQAKALFSYTVNCAVEGCSPNSIIAHTALSTFYASVSEESPAISDRINDSAVVSQYILAGTSRGRGSVGEIGQVFAKLCLYEGNDRYIALGEALYEKYLKQSSDMIGAVPFENV